MLDEDSVFETNSFSYPTLKNLFERDRSETFVSDGEDDKGSTRSEMVKSKSLMDVSQIKVGNIKLIEEAPKLR